MPPPIPIDPGPPGLTKNRGAKCGVGEMRRRRFAGSEPGTCETRQNVALLCSPYATVPIRGGGIASTCTSRCPLLLLPGLLWSARLQELAVTWRAHGAEARWLRWLRAGRKKGHSSGDETRLVRAGWRCNTIHATARREGRSRNTIRPPHSRRTHGWNASAGFKRAVDNASATAERKSGQSITRRHASHPN